MNKATSTALLFLPLLFSLCQAETREIVFKEMRIENMANTELHWYHVFFGSGESTDCDGNCRPPYSECNVST